VLGGQNVAIPVTPKCCRHGVEHNKRAGVPTLASVRQDPIGGAGSPRQLLSNDEGPLNSDGSRGVNIY
jgi:hypothetical protein